MVAPGPAKELDVPSSRTCVACGVAEMEPFADLGAVPVFLGVSYDDREEARASPAAPLELHVCPACAHVYNVAFDPALLDYGSGFDNTLHHSATFQAFASELSGRLAAEYLSTGSHVVEIGCGKGHFLVELCRTADCRGTGYDTSYDGEVTDERVSFLRTYMSWDEPADFDFFVSRHVLEHIAEPYDFLVGLRKACGRRRVGGYIEVPDAIYDFERSPWNCIYPHVSYFSATSLARVATRAGFEIFRLSRSFEGQYLSLDLGVNMATPNEVHVGGMGLRTELSILAGFPARHAKIVQVWRDRLETIGYERCALWGAGAKGLEFVHAVDPNGRLAAVVDLNPNKHGRHLPVTGHRISSPEELVGRDLESVIITNPAYRAEVEASLLGLGLDATVLCAH